MLREGRGKLAEALAGRWVRYVSERLLIIMALPINAGGLSPEKRIF